MEKQTQVEQGTQVETTKAVELPAILTANTFYWRPGRTARERRANEQRHYAEVEGVSGGTQGDLANGGY